MHSGKPKALKKNNRKTVLDLLRTSKKISVAEISKKVKLSKTTLMKVINYFVETGYVVPAGKGTSTDEGGKKPILYRFNEKAAFVIGIHIYPKEIYAALTDLSTKIIDEISTPIKKNSNVSLVIDKLSEACEKLIEKNVDINRLIGIGVGMNGIVNYKEGILISSPHFPSWGTHLKFRDMLSDRLGLDVPITIDNDCRFQVLAEKTTGVAKDKKNIVTVECGAGLGAGILVKNEIKRGSHFLAGEIGHMIIAPNAADQCKCGGKGCFEVMVSAERICKIARQKLKKSANSLISPSAKKRDELFIEDIFEASNKSDPLACKIMDEAIKWFAIGFLNIILMYDPEVVVIQGVYAKAGDYFITTLREKINALSLVNIEKNVEIKYSTLGKERSAIGSAAYIISEYIEQICSK